jgi:catechol 2,3-dioxygenase-like lactoylglutathione lyase family enzyme
MKSFYKDVLEFNKLFIEFPETEHGEIYEVMRGVRPVFAATLLYQEAGGIIVELVHMTSPIPRAIRTDFRYGDIGVNKMTIAVSSVERLYKEMKNRVDFCSGPKSVAIPGWGDYHFVYCRDPEGNLIEFVAGAKLPVRNRFGGIRWLGVSVTDLKRSMSFYQKYAGFDTVVINVHEKFSGLVDEVSGGRQTRVRSCVLASSQGDGMVELFEVLEPRGRSIPSFTIWGDFGYWQVCLNCDNVREIAAYFEKEGVEFFTRLQLMHDEREGSFIYIKDPDGIPVEFLGFLKPG